MVRLLRGSFRTGHAYGVAVAHENTVLFPSVDRIAFHEYHVRYGERGSRVVDPRDGVLRVGSGQAYAG